MKHVIYLYLCLLINNIAVSRLDISDAVLVNVTILYNIAVLTIMRYCDIMITVVAAIYSTSISVEHHSLECVDPVQTALIGITHSKTSPSELDIYLSSFDYRATGKNTFFVDKAYCQWMLGSSVLYVWRSCMCDDSIRFYCRYMRYMREYSSRF